MKHSDVILQNLKGLISAVLFRNEEYSIKKL